MTYVATKLDAKLNQTSFDVMNQVLTSYCTELGAKTSKLNHDTGTLCSQINEIFSSGRCSHPSGVCTFISCKGI